MKLKFDIDAFTRYFTEHPWVIGLTKYARENSFIGFKGVPIYDVMVFVINEATRDDLFTRANSVAFSFFLSLFPSILTLFTLTPFILDLLSIWFPELENFNMTLYGEIKRVMPGQAGDILFGFVQDVTNSPKVGLLSFGFLLAIYFSTNGMIALMQAFEKSYVEVFRQRGFLRKRMVAAGLTFLIGLFIVASVILVILGDSIIGWIDYWMGLGGFSIFLIDVIRWVTMLSLYYIIIGSLYRYGAATIERFSYVSPGVTLATLLSLATSVAFSFYIDGFNRYDTYTKFYGSIATIIIVMLWLQLNALILIIGFELNAAIAVHRDLTVVEEEGVEEE